ncbi:hypothetical protein B7463_g4304, partial [Scytalidium lignicola]
MPTKGSHEKPPAIVGVDQLWKWQLRKEHSALLMEMEKYKAGLNKDEEHAAILAKLNDQEEKVKAMAEQCTRKFEEAEVRINQLEKSIFRLEEQELARIKAAKDIIIRQPELTDSPTTMPVDLRGNPRETMIVKLRIDPRRIISTQSPIRPQETTTTSSRQPPDSAVRCSSTRSSSLTNMTTASLIMARTLNKEAEIAVLSEPSAGTETVSKPSIAEPICKKQPAHIPHENTKKGSTIFSMPKLAQGRSTLEDYVQKSQTLARDVPKDREVEFIAAFIKGIKNASTRKKLVQKLMSIHPSTTKGKNEVEIICMWSDVEDGLRKANLALLSTTSVPSKKKEDDNPSSDVRFGLLIYFLLEFAATSFLFIASHKYNRRSCIHFCYRTKI